MPESKVIWTETALKCLSEIYFFLNDKSETSAKRQIVRILSRENQLKKLPESGQVAMLKTLTKQYRYLIEGKYKIVYHIENQVIFIDLVFDTRQDPDKLKL